MAGKLGNFMRITIAGGILFLIPVGVIVFILAKTVNFLYDLSRPITALLPFRNVAGVGVNTLMSIILLLLICFLAGIFMRTKFAKKIIQWLEDRVLVFVPGYSYIRARSTDWFSNEKTNTWKPATIFVDDNEVICFVIDETSDYCSIFLPAAPVPSSGSICVREKKNVTFLPINVAEAVSMIRQFGKGASSSMEKVTNEVFENRK
jgi:uncharacterized membrane protein